MITILSSAKTMDFSPWAHKVTASKACFQTEMKNLLLLLRLLSVEDLRKLMRLSPKLAELNYKRFQDFQANKKNVGKPAILAYQGDVYLGLDASSLKKSDLDFGQAHLRIISGLYGMLSPLDLIQAYRLEMATKLKNIAGKDLYIFWQQIITKKINQELIKQKYPFLINLASEEYSKVIIQKELNSPCINIAFKQKAGNALKNVGLYAKRARGLIAREILINRWDRPNDLKNFNCENYRFDNKLSDDLNFVFVRNWK